jgi:large repetitive protein
MTFSRLSRRHVRTGTTCLLAVTTVVGDGCGRVGFDLPLPALSLTTPIRIVNREDSAVFAGRCEPGLEVAVSGFEIGRTTCDNGTWSYKALPEQTDGERVFVFSQTRAGGGTASISASWIRDTLGPEFWAGQFAINGGAALTQSNYVATSFSGTDAHSRIVAFCLKWNERTDPEATSSCWTRIDAPVPGLTPQPTILVVDFPFRIGFVPGVYTVCGWLEDELGNVSALTNDGLGTDGMDCASIRYDPGSPPVVSDILATVTDAPDNPPTQAQLTAAAGVALIIKWRAEDVEGLDANPISLYYTSDDLTFSVIAVNVANGQNGNCLVDHPATAADDRASGCYQWTSGAPTSAYFRVRVLARDSGGTVSAATSTPLNTPEVRFLAGNTDPGTDTSARAAMFFNYVGDTRNVADPDTFVVTQWGDVYFRDVLRGILVVRADDGVLRVLVPTTGTTSGDGGPARSATLRFPFKISLDHRGGLLVFDYDRIRRIDLALPDPMVETLIGGGTLADETAAPLDLRITPPPARFDDYSAHEPPLFALPNGDIYFQSESYGGVPAQGQRFRVYRAASRMVESLHISGTSDTINPGQDVSQCGIWNLGVEFDPVTSQLTYAQTSYQASRSYSQCLAPGGGVEAYSMLRFDPQTGVAIAAQPVDPFSFDSLAYPVVGLNGRLYLVSRFNSSILAIDSSSLELERVVGTDVLGTCADGTAALACDIDPQAAFVDAAGRLYFMERGRLRTIEPDGTVITVMGQSYSFGDGASPQSARFAELTTLSVWRDSTIDHFVVLDGKELRIRELSPGLTVQTIAGNGSNAAADVTAEATAQGIEIDVGGSRYPAFVAEPGNGEIYFQIGREYLGRLDRATGRWTRIAGQGATDFALGDGLPGPQLAFPGSYPPQAVGYDGGRVLVAVNGYDSAAMARTDMLWKSYDTAGLIQRHVAGVAGLVRGNPCDDGDSLDNCDAPSCGWRLIAVARDAAAGRWLVVSVDPPSGNEEVVAFTDAGTAQHVATVPHWISGLAYRGDATLSTQIVYYCSDGVLYSYDVNTGVEQAYTMPSSTMTCSGRALAYSSVRGSLIFGFLQNNLGGLAEWLSP